MSLAVAAKAGFNFTVEDFKEVFDNNEEGESSAEELKAVAGGVRRNDLRNTTNVVVNC